MLELIDVLRTYSGYEKFYYAGLNLASQDDFTGDEALAAKNDFDAIEKVLFLFSFTQPNWLQELW